MSTFCATGKFSINIRELFVQPEDLPSTSVNFMCSQETFHRQLLTFRRARRPFINFSKYSVRTEELLSTFFVAGRPSGNFWQLSVLPGDSP